MSFLPIFKKINQKIQSSKKTKNLKVDLKKEFEEISSLTKKRVLKERENCDFINSQSLLLE